MATGINSEARAFLTPEVISALENLTTVNSGSGMWDVARDYIVIFATTLLASYFDSYIFAFFAVFYIGVRQRYLSNLGHELTHSKLVIGKKATQALGIFVMFTLGEPFDSYRRSHWRHHTKLGLMGDPMYESYLAGGALNPQGSQLKFLINIYLKSVVFRLPFQAVVVFTGRGESESLLAYATRLFLWSILLIAAFHLEFGEIFIIYWIVPLLLIRPAVTWLTDLGNHAGVICNKEFLLQTRGWTSNWLTMHLLGGHLDDMYHPVHHLCPTVPWKRLPEAEEILRNQVPEWQNVPWCSGFFFRRTSTPDIPCVLEDIVNRTK